MTDIGKELRLDPIDFLKLLVGVLQGCLCLLKFET